MQFWCQWKWEGISYQWACSCTVELAERNAERRTDVTVTAETAMTAMSVDVTGWLAWLCDLSIHTAAVHNNNVHVACNVAHHQAHSHALIKLPSTNISHENLALGWLGCWMINSMC
jgi:hypothetical protein